MAAQTPDTPPALTAAQRLAKQGRHVHYVADGHARCLSERCTP